MIIETEAYDQNDPFAHCYSDALHTRPKGSDPMFLEAGNIYIYYSGQLPCLNLVCDAEQFGSAVLIRSLLPTCNDGVMFDRRTEWYLRTGRPIPKCLEGKNRGRNLCNGPAVLCESLGISGCHYEKSKAGLSLFAPPFEIREAVLKPKLVSGIRVGLDKQLQRWKKNEPSRAVLDSIRMAGGLRLRWCADEFRLY
jgi:3-methyladenine DNA glycosylase Mpg